MTIQNHAINVPVCHIAVCAEKNPEPLSIMEDNLLMWKAFGKTAKALDIGGSTDQKDQFPVMKLGHRIWKASASDPRDTSRVVSLVLDFLPRFVVNDAGVEKMSREGR